jgi:hypothetical protein
VTLVTHHRLGHRRLLPQRLQGDSSLAFSAASIFRLGFFIIVSVYHDGADLAGHGLLAQPRNGTSNDITHIL